jgi:3-oxoisoapionate decarboxylase
MRIGLASSSFAALRRADAAQMDGLPVPRDWYGMADLAQALGLTGIETGVPLDTAPEEVARMRGYAAERGLTPVLMGGVVTRVDGPALIRLARALGADTLRLTLSSVLEGDRGRLGPGGWLRLRDESAARLREWRPVAEECGVRLALENHQDAGSDDLLWLCKQAGGDFAGVTLDAGNPLAVGEEPMEFARRVMPVLHNIHLKDYTIHRTPSGYRLVRCALGAGVIDFPTLLAMADREAPSAHRGIELAATQARHIRLFEEAWWEHFPPRDVRALLPVLRLVERTARPADEEWRTPHEREETHANQCAYELRQLRESVRYLQSLTPQPSLGQPSPRRDGPASGEEH